MLERLGCEVEFRADQTCCGQMHGNSGYEDEARPLLERFARVFDGAEAVVSPSASCAGFVREPPAHGRPVRGPPVYELTEFLIDVLGVEDVGASFPHRVTLHPTCHSLRALRVGDRPARLLRAVRGIDLVELGEAQECCGFGGTFAVKNADTSMAMLGDKLRPRARHARRGLHGGRHLLPDAHRRRAPPPAGRRADDAHRRDPGGAGMSHGFPAAARDALRRRPAAPQPRQGDDDDPRQARAGRWPSCDDWEALRDAGAAIKARAMATLPGAARAAGGSA